MSHKYEARVTWSRQNAEKFTDNRYSRAHEWSFDGGITVRASSSPSVVPLPLSAADAVDPEEALVASASSCHMLWFLSLAAERGFVVDRYEDEALGTMGRIASERFAVTDVALRPRIVFGGATQPDAAQERSSSHLGPAVRERVIGTAT